MQWNSRWRFVFKRDKTVNNIILELLIFGDDLLVNSFCARLRSREGCDISFKIYKKVEEK